MGRLRHGAARLPRRSGSLKWFNITMGVLLAATLWPMLKLQDQNSTIAGRVSISQKIASAAKKAGKPQANQMR